jgi:hypothetical protein
MRCLFNKIVIPDAAEAAIRNPVTTEIKNYRRGLRDPRFRGDDGKVSNAFSFAAFGED